MDIYINLTIDININNKVGVYINTRSTSKIMNTTDIEENKLEDNKLANNEKSKNILKRFFNILIDYFL